MDNRSVFDFGSEQDSEPNNMYGDGEDPTENHDVSAESDENSMEDQQELQLNRSDDSKSYFCLYNKWNLYIFMYVIKKQIIIQTEKVISSVCIHDIHPSY